MKAMINIPRQLTHGDDLVVIRRADYEALQEKLEEFKMVIKKIKQGEEEFKSGKTKVVHSLAQLR